MLLLFLVLLPLLHVVNVTRVVSIDACCYRCAVVVVSVVIHCVVAECIAGCRCCCCCCFYCLCCLSCRGCCFFYRLLVFVVIDVRFVIVFCCGVGSVYVGCSVGYAVVLSHCCHCTRCLCLCYRCGCCCCVLLRNLWAWCYVGDVAFLCMLLRVLLLLGVYCCFVITCTAVIAEFVNAPVVVFVGVGVYCRCV